MQTAITLVRRPEVLLAHFGKRLRETPLLLGWLLIGLFVTLLLNGWNGLALGLVNVALLGLYAILIRWLTPNVPPAKAIKRPRLELGLALALLVLVLIIQLLDFGVWQFQPWQAWVRAFFLYIQQWVLGLGLPGWAEQRVFLAFSSTFKQLIPTLLVFCLLGCHPRVVGLAHPHWKLTALLVGITTVFGLLSSVLFSAPLWQVLALYMVGILVNALPEELFFRGLLLPRLERLFGNPLNALVLSALLFNALHIPIALSQGVPLLTAVLSIFSMSYPTGLLWGYLYLRTRSILPGMFWHAANGNLGFILFS